MKGIILAGGKGTRLRPVTYEIPKPLLPVKKKPIVNHLIEFFLRHDITRIILLASQEHQPDFERWQKTWGDTLPFTQISILYEETPRGTFGGLEKLKSSFGEDDFLLANGDTLKEFDLKKFIAFHRTRRPAATVSLAQTEEPQQYGVPVLEGDHIVDFLEKPPSPVSNFVSSGFYVLSPVIFKYADFFKNPLMIESDIMPRLAQERQLLGFKVPRVRWYDCGTFERWEKAMREWQT